MFRATIAAVAALMVASAAAAATGEPPRDFAGIRFGASPAQLRSQYGDLRRNPDSDRDYEVLQVQALREVEVKSPGAFDFYQGKLVGGQVMLSNSTAGYWLQKARTQYGQPDRCDYCEYPDMASAQWKWPDGTSVKVE